MNTTERTGIITALIAVAAACDAASAVTIFVPGDQPTIQAALAAADDGDEIVVAPGTWAERIDFLGKAVLLRASDPDPALTIIDAGGLDTVVRLESGEGADSVLDGFTITGGSGAGGGARIFNASPTIRNCVFEFNHSPASGGGGALILDASPTIQNCVFEFNEASLSGGGISTSGGDPLIADCTFRRNHSTDQGGGGMYVRDGSPTIQNCVFEFNEAFYGGGAISTTQGNPLIADCTFRRNQANNGGGVLVIEGSAVISGCVFADNEATAGGGGIDAASGSPLVVDCRFRNNSASNGGGLQVGSGSLVVNCIVRDNIATTGAGVRVMGDATLVNCTVVNQPANGGIDVHGGYHLTAANCIIRGNGDYDLEVHGTATVEYSNIGGGYPGPGNIDAPARFVDPASNDYRLDAGSPCIDAADNTAVPAGVEWDLLGTARFINDPSTPDTGRGNPPIVDMGAAEYLPQIRYVNVEATGADNGQTWADAYVDLRDALDEAAAGGVAEIWVAAGTYKPDRGTDDRTMSFEMISGVEIMGGFAGGETDRDARDPDANVTTLGGAIGAEGTADNTFHVVRAVDVSATGKLDGFVIQKGHADGAGTDAMGAGILIEGGAPRILRCIVRINECSAFGAGLASLGSDAAIHRSRFNRNVANGSVGGGLLFDGGTPHVVNCFIFGNAADRYGGAVYASASTLHLTNSTVFGNDARGGLNGGVMNEAGTLLVANSILWGNTGLLGSAEPQQLWTSGGTTSVDYTCVEGWTGVMGGTFNFGFDPGFVDADGPDDVIGTGDDDVRLTAGSRSIDSGSNSRVPAGVERDLPGDDRFVDDPGMPDTGQGAPPHVDRGAYEFTGTSCLADIDRDGVVAFGDLLVVLASWGACEGCPADVNLDDVVDFTDLLVVLAAWGPCP